MKMTDWKHFDMAQKPMRQKNYLRPVTWLLSYPTVWINRTKITRINTAGLKPPYLLLCNHNSFADFKVTTAAVFPARANYVVAIDGFIGREGLLRKVGCVCKRKFTNDVTLVRQLERVSKNGDIVVLYPEARYSLAGTNAVLPESLGKLAKFLGIPVVTLIINGHHLLSPFWNLHVRGRFGVRATMTRLFTAEELKTASVEQINEKINAAFKYDDFAWQRDNHIKIDYPDRAKGLHKVLYQCPHCKAEYKTDSEGNRIFCRACGKVWEMSEYGELKATEGETEFSHVPDWYEWEREQVRSEIERGQYFFKSEVTVQALPNADGFIPMGTATLTHSSDGFLLEGVYEGEPYTVQKSVASMYSCHIEYEYLGKYGDCVDLNTLTDTYYIYPQGCEFSVTKLSLATEELYDAAKRAEIKKPVAHGATV